MIPFSGVRSSWLILDRKSLLARLARSASASACRRSVISCWSCSLATRSSRVRSCTRCSSSSAWRFTRSWRRACAIVMANRAATSCAMAICSGENCPGAPPKLTPPMSSPTAIMGTTMYTWTPEASPAAPDRRQPLHLAGLQVEHVHDGPWYTEQVAQLREHRRGDRRGLLRGDDRPVDLVEDFEPLRVFGERDLGLLQLRDVGRHDERRAPTLELEGVRRDIDGSDATVFQSMAPGPRVSSHLPGRRRPESRHGVREPWHLLLRADVGDAHAKKLVA